MMDVQHGETGKLWAQHWHRMIEGISAYGDTIRLDEGIALKEQGRVARLEVSVASVFAQVQSETGEFYEVSIQFRPISAAGWHELFTRLVRERDLVGDLETRELPEAMDGLFMEIGLSVLPEAGEMDAACECPEWANPCKHAYAALATLEQSIEENPLTLILLRGLPEAIWLDRVGQCAARSRALFGKSARQRNPDPNGNTDPNGSTESYGSTGPDSGVDPNSREVLQTPSLVPWVNRDLPPRRLPSSDGDVHPETGKALTPSQALWFAARDNAFWQSPPPDSAGGKSSGESERFAGFQEFEGFNPLAITPTDDLRAGFGVYRFGKPPFPLPRQDAMTELRDLYRQMSERATRILEEELGLPIAEKSSDE